MIFIVELDTIVRFKHMVGKNKNGKGVEITDQ